MRNFVSENAPVTWNKLQYHLWVFTEKRAYIVDGRTALCTRRDER